MDCAVADWAAGVGTGGGWSRQAALKVRPAASSAVGPPQPRRPGRSFLSVGIETRRDVRQRRWPFCDVPETPFARADGKIRGNLSRMSLSVPVMQSTRRYGGLRIFLLYCSLLAIGGPAMFWAARLGLRVAPGHVQGFVGWFANIDDLSELFVALPREGDREGFLAAAELGEAVLA